MHVIHTAPCLAKRRCLTCVRCLPLALPPSASPQLDKEVPAAAQWKTSVVLLMRLGFGLFLMYLELLTPSALCCGRDFPPEQRSPRCHQVGEKKCSPPSHQELGNPSEPSQQFKCSVHTMESACIDRNTLSARHQVFSSRMIAHSTLAAVAQWIERQPVNQSVAGSIPSQGTCLGCRPGP